MLPKITPLEKRRVFSGTTGQNERFVNILLFLRFLRRFADDLLLGVVTLPSFQA
jgi:hypothetical protein